MSEKESWSNNSAAINADVSGEQKTNPLTKKLSKILETRLDGDKEILESLKTLSSYFGENSLKTRRNLRSDIERRSLQIDEEFLNNLDQLKVEIDNISVNVHSINSCFQNMMTRLRSDKSRTQDLISQTTQLQSTNLKLQYRMKIADAFLAKFQLKQEDIQVLRSARDGRLHQGFFDALSKLKRIHNDCKILLQTNHQTAGLEIMESMAMHQETAYEYLYRWAQNECRLMTAENIDISSQLASAMAALSDRPILFKYTLDEFASARRRSIVKGFIDALTKGGVGGTPSPIEIHSHDPLRYISDILAWLHQALATEKEYVTSLLVRCSGVENTILQIMDHITEGLCTSLKMRLEQLLVSEPGPLVLYKISSFLKFYFQTLQQILPANAALLQTCSEMHSLCLRMFFTNLSTYGMKISEKMDQPPADLSPPLFLQQSLQLLQDILSSQDTSVVSPDEKIQDFAKILTSMVDPMIQMCSVSATNLQTVEMAVFMVNCLHSIYITLAVYEFTDTKLEVLHSLVEAHIDTLVSEQAGYILHQAGLAPLYAITQQISSASLTNSNFRIDPKDIKSAMYKFDHYLASPESLTLDQCKFILSTKYKDAVKQRAVRLICQGYRQIYDTLITRNDYDLNQVGVTKTPEQVDKLLF